MYIVPQLPRAGSIRIRSHRAPRLLNCLFQRVRGLRATPRRRQPEEQRINS